MKHYYLYKITNSVNGKIYIGVHETVNLDDEYMGSGRYLHAAISKYGIENFRKEILEYFNSSHEMYEREREIVNEEFLNRADVYNLNIGGEGGWHRCNSTGKNLYGKNGQTGFGRQNLLPRDEQIALQKERGTYEAIIKKISETTILQYENGRINPFLGKSHSAETKKTIGDISSIRESGSGNSQYGTMWITNTTTGKHTKIKKDELIPEGWIKGRINFQSMNERKNKEELNREMKRLRNEEKINQHREWYSLYSQIGFDKFKELTNYKYSKSNLVQNFAKCLPEFIPQNGKKRN